MKVFWWGSADTIHMYAPRLYKAELDAANLGNPGVQEMYNPSYDLPALVEEEYQEISVRTAHMLGLPT